MDLSFLRLPPSADLADYVLNFWFMRGSGPAVMPEGHRILPDGCMEFVFQLGEPFRERGVNGRWRMQPHLLLVGQLERRVDIKPSGLIHTVGIHFKPAGLAAFVSGDLGRFANRIWPLREQLGEDLDPLVSQLKSARTTKGQVVALESFLRRRLRSPDLGMTDAAAELSTGSGPMNIEAVARQLSLSERQFRRRFQAVVGIAPKRFARLIRFQRVFEGRREQDGRAWCDVALGCGYYDQAHFNRDFRAFTGVKPRDIVKDADPLTAFFLSVSSKTAGGDRR